MLHPTLHPSDPQFLSFSTVLSQGVYRLDKRYFPL
jgi:hypothetical protein